MEHEGKEYPILKNCGDGWQLEILDADPRGGHIVRVTTFSGPCAEQMARAMYDSIR